jgi:NADPH-dependent 2,4-dienoyl-CoA reductase/sulfur reductase-like enzyme
MKRKKIVVIGGTAAGPSAAAKAARVNPNAEVVLYEATDTISYGMCETPYLLGGALSAEERLVTYTPERLHDEKRVDARISHLVEKIIPAKRRIIVRNLKEQRADEVGYDALIIATGTSPRRLGLANEDARNVFHLSSRSDTLAIERYLTTEAPKQVAIIGGGFVAMEMAEAFRARGLAVTIIHRHRLPMPVMEEETGEALRWELERNGVELLPDARVEAFVPDSHAKIRHIITTRGTIEADLILSAIGVEPNAALARTAKLRIGAHGGILTNSRQQTSVDSIYAAGDCCELVNFVTGGRMVISLATVASKTGWVAGENAAGGQARFSGVVRAMGVKVFDMETAVVGLSGAEAHQAGMAADTSTVHAYEKIALFPDAQKISVRLLFEQRSGRLLGANLFGKAGVMLRANTLSLAVRKKMTVGELGALDCLYAPPLSPLWDPLLIAAHQAAKKIS